MAARDSPSERPLVGELVGSLKYVKVLGTERASVYIRTEQLLSVTGLWNQEKGFVSVVDLEEIAAKVSALVKGYVLLVVSEQVLARV